MLDHVVVVLVVIDVWINMRRGSYSHRMVAVCVVAYSACRFSVRHAHATTPMVALVGWHVRDAQTEEKTEKCFDTRIYI